MGPVTLLGRHPQALQPGLARRPGEPADAPPDHPVLSPCSPQEPLLHPSPGGSLVMPCPAADLSAPHQPGPAASPPSPRANGEQFPLKRVVTGPATKELPFDLWSAGSRDQKALQGQESRRRCRPCTGWSCLPRWGCPLPLQDHSLCRCPALSWQVLEGVNKLRSVAPSILLYRFGGPSIYRGSLWAIPTRGTLCSFLNCPCCNLLLGSPSELRGEGHPSGLLPSAVLQQVQQRQRRQLCARRDGSPFWLLLRSLLCPQTHSPPDLQAKPWGPEHRAGTPPTGPKDFPKGNRSWGATPVPAPALGGWSGRRRPPGFQAEDLGPLIAVCTPPTPGGFPRP
ncbi:uncharacterized protein LOC119509979 [Choloepus didactylus]|uniref:uncharacterized protein LOC119509979 n=1 Tax=Choloepus didactylus TaxID=27675 RepID=UPI00189D8611|nr:uncharacterized protein LOC119509979 [Choloepus didactylus]